MENFTNFKSLYDHLEKNAADYKYSHQIGNLFQKLRDLKANENRSGEAEKAQWELDFFNFTAEDGRLNPMYPGTNDKGEIIEYPTLDRFDDKTYEYLIGRLDSTSNPILKARYSHILWCSPKKHTEYAKMAVDSYLELVKIYEAKDRKKPQKHYGFDVLNAVKNAYSVAFQIRYKVDKIKSELRRLVNTFNFQSGCSFALRADIIELMLKNKRRFSKKDFLGFEKICRQISKSLTKAGDIHIAIEMLELGEKVERKLEQKTHNCRKQIAEAYEALTKQAEKNNNPASLTFCQHALENYKKLKDKEKVNELEKKYSELKNSMKLAEIKTRIDLTDHLKKCKEVAARLVQNEPDGIIKILMLHEDILPKYKDMEKVAEKHAEQFPLQYLFFQKEIIDQSGHPAQHFSDEDEKKYFSILQRYGRELKLNKLYLINEIFFAAIRENKLSSDNLLAFLNRHSWFGKNISKKLTSNKTIEYNWLNLIAPALHEYFLQMRYYFLGAIEYPNLVLSMDSLTLKIEGLLRDICQFSGVTTFRQTQDSKGRNVVREKGIHALMHEESIKTLFDEDDLLFLKFLLIEQAGYNLRHKVAHSLLLFREYDISYMHLLILALLRLGKYDFPKRKGSVAHDSGQKEN